MSNDLLSEARLAYAAKLADEMDERAWAGKVRLGNGAGADVPKLTKMVRDLLAHIAALAAELAETQTREARTVTLYADAVARSNAAEESRAKSCEIVIEGSHRAAMATIRRETEMADARREGAREERRLCMVDAQEVEDEARGNGEAGAVAGALRVKMAIRARGEGRPPCPGEGWEWDDFAQQWHQPGAKGPAIGRAF